MGDDSEHSKRGESSLKRFNIWCWNDKENFFPPIRTFFLLGSFLFYILDVVLDLWVAGEHYIAARSDTDPYAEYYFQATLFFIVFPLLVVNFLSWALYTWGWMYRFTVVRRFWDKRAENFVFYETDPHTEQVKRAVLTKQFIVSRPLKKKWNSEKNQCLNSNNSNNHGASSAAGSFPLQNITPDSSHVPSGSRDSEHMIARQEDEDLSDDQINQEGHDEVDAGGSNETDGLTFYPLDFFSTREWVCVSIIHLFQIGYLFRVLRLLYKNYKRVDYYVFDRYRDLSFLRLMEAFLEAAPQSVLQLYIMIIRQEPRLIYQVITPISVGFSVISLALAVGNYISAEKDLCYYDPPPVFSDEKQQSRPLQRHYKRLSWCGYIVLIFWHLFMIIGRLFSLAFFASVYGRYVFLVFGLHYAMMVYFAYKQNTHVFVTKYDDYFGYLNPRNHLCSNLGIEFLIACFCTFFHFKLNDGSALESIVPFYTIILVENTICIFLWYIGRDWAIEIWYSEAALVMVFGTFLIGLGLLVLYYWHFQPQHQPPPENAPCPDVHHPTTMTASLSRRYRFYNRTI